MSKNEFNFPDGYLEPFDPRAKEAAMMAAFRALPFENRVLPGMGQVELMGEKFVVQGDPIMSLHAHDSEGNSITYQGTPFQVVRVDNDAEYPLRLHIRLHRPQHLRNRPAQVLFSDHHGEEPAVLLHGKTAILLKCYYD